MPPPRAPAKHTSASPASPILLSALCLPSVTSKEDERAKLAVRLRKYILHRLVDYDERVNHTQPADWHCEALTAVNGVGFLVGYLNAEFLHADLSGACGQISDEGVPLLWP